jgi:hypothetical protein
MVFAFMVIELLLMQRINASGAARRVDMAGWVGQCEDVV